MLLLHLRVRPYAIAELKRLKENRQRIQNIANNNFIEIVGVLDMPKDVIFDPKELLHVFPSSPEIYGGQLVQKIIFHFHSRYARLNDQAKISSANLFRTSDSTDLLVSLICRRSFSTGRKRPRFNKSKGFWPLNASV